MSDTSAVPTQAKSITRIDRYAQVLLGEALDHPETMAWLRKNSSAYNARDDEYFVFLFDDKEIDQGRMNSMMKSNISEHVINAYREACEQGLQLLNFYAG